jgi:hypothetical protein
MSNATCPAPYWCDHCKLPFNTPEDLKGHLERSGHGSPPHAFQDEHPRCACGMVLIAAVSVHTSTCSACRWEQRRSLRPDELRTLARSFRTKAEGFRLGRQLALAEDYFSEARALEDEAQEREDARG